MCMCIQLISEAVIGQEYFLCSSSCSGEYEHTVFCLDKSEDSFDVPLIRFEPKSSMTIKIEVYVKCI
jgi:hypothetical protein